MEFVNNLDLTCMRHEVVKHQNTICTVWDKQCCAIWSDLSSTPFSSSSIRDERCFLGLNSSKEGIRKIVLEGKRATEKELQLDI